jgi:predicted Fe-Mo cluster-binding NifX family protein
MKIAIPCKVDCPTSPIEEKFGQSRHFAIYDPESKIIDFVTFPEYIDGGSAGLFAVKQLIASGVDVVMAGMISPHIVQAFEEADIKIIPNQYGNILDILNDFRRYRNNYT